MSRHGWTITNEIDWSALAYWLWGSITFLACLVAVRIGVEIWKELREWPPT